MNKSWNLRKQLGIYCDELGVRYLCAVLRFTISGKDYEAEALYEASNIRSKVVNAKYILELGCGTRAHLEHLSRMGYEDHVVDMSAEMLARAEASKATLHADMAARQSFGLGEARELYALRKPKMLRFHFFM